MALTDYGNLADYVLQGQTWTQVQADGSTKVIPSSYGTRPLIPEGQIQPNFYIPAIGCEQPCSTCFACAIWLHDDVTDLYYVLDQTANSLIPPEYPDCCSYLLATNDVQADIANSLSVVQFPAWLFDLLGLPHDTLPHPDSFFCACFGAPLFLPALIPAPLAGSCPPPGLIQLVNGVPVCVMDPPMPSAIPRPYHETLRMASPARPRGRGTARPAGRGAEARLSRIRALNPTRNAGKPFIFKSCGCDGPDFTEPVGA